MLASYSVSLVESLVPTVCACAIILQKTVYNLYSFSKFEFPSACYVTSDDVMPKSLLEVEPVLA